MSGRLLPALVALRVALGGKTACHGSIASVVYGQWRDHGSDVAMPTPGWLHGFLIIISCWGPEGGFLSHEF